MGDSFTGFVNVDSGPERDLAALVQCVRDIKEGGSKYNYVAENNGDINKKINELDQTIKNSTGDSDEAKAARADAEVNKVLYSYAQNIYYGRDVGDSGDNYTVLKELGEYFKTAAWYVDVNEGDWSPTRSSIVGAILYTMFVFQSIMFFIAYVKRFFFVIILSIIAPFVIIYDFFKSSIAI